MTENIKELEEKKQIDYAEYRLRRLLEILLEADLRRLDGLCQTERDEKNPSPIRNNLINNV